MKKILLAILLCIATLFAFSATVFAEEGDAVADPTVQTETSTEEPATPSEDNSHTLFTRIWEFVNEHKTDTLSLAGEALILGLAFLLKRKMDKSSAVAKETKDGVEATRGGQSSVVDAVNRMIDGYNNMKESFDINGALESDKNRVVNALVAQTAAILEILITAYAHSKLPQGVKQTGA